MATRKQAAELTEDEIKSLIKKSRDAKEKAYAPYSNFRVGAALMTDDGTKVFTGGCVHRAGVA